MEFIKCTNLQTGKQKLYASIIVRNHAMRTKIGIIVSDPNYDANGNKLEKEAFEVKPIATPIIAPIKAEQEDTFPVVAEATKTKAKPKKK